MSVRSKVGLAGCALLFLGVFAPIVQVPIIGNINYFMNGEGDGVAVMVLALVSLGLVLARRFEWLWLTGLGCGGLLLFTFVNFRQALTAMDSELTGSVFAEVLGVAIQIQWGWAVLGLGVACLLACAAMKRDPAS